MICSFFSTSAIALSAPIPVLFPKEREQVMDRINRERSSTSFNLFCPIPIARILIFFFRVSIGLGAEQISL